MKSKAALCQYETQLLIVCSSSGRLEHKYLESETTFSKPEVRELTLVLTTLCPSCTSKSVLPANKLSDAAFSCFAASETKSSSELDAAVIVETEPVELATR